MAESVRTRLARLERATKPDPLAGPDYARGLYTELLEGRGLPMPAVVDVPATVELWLSEPGALFRRFLRPPAPGEGP